MLPDIIQNVSRGERRHLLQPVTNANNRPPVLPVFFGQIIQPLFLRLPIRLQLLNIGAMLVQDMLHLRERRLRLGSITIPRTLTMRDNPVNNRCNSAVTKRTNQQRHYCLNHAPFLMSASRRSCLSMCRSTRARAMMNAASRISSMDRGPEPGDSVRVCTHDRYA